MKKVAILNDTMEWYHWGCTATSTALRAQLEESGYQVVPIPIMMTYAFKGTPQSLTDFVDPNFFRDRVKANQLLFEFIKGVDLVVVNGEGTLHSIRPASLNLLYLSFVCKKFLNKPVSIINHSMYPSTLEENVQANDTYKFVYKEMDYVAIREHISFAVADRLGIEASLSFDCLPLTAREFNFPDPKDEGPVVITDSVIVSKDDMRVIERIVKGVVKKGRAVTILYGAKSNPGQDMINFVAHLQAKFKHNVNFVNARSLEQWFSVIANASVLVSGRFHYTIAAAFLGTPFVLLDTNTLKNKALAEEFGSDSPLSYSTPKVADLVLERLEGVSDLPLLDVSKKETIYSRAMKNFQLPS